MERHRSQISLTAFVKVKLQGKAEEEEKPVSRVITDILRDVAKGNLVLKSGKNYFD